MASFNYRNIEMILSELGFTPIRQDGSHVRFSDDAGHHATVPMHRKKDIPTGTVQKIFREAGCKQAIGNPKSVQEALVRAKEIRKHRLSGLALQ